MTATPARPGQKPKLPPLPHEQGHEELDADTASPSGSSARWSDSALAQAYDLLADIGRRLRCRDHDTVKANRQETPRGWRPIRSGIGRGR